MMIPDDLPEVPPAECWVVLYWTERDGWVLADAQYAEESDARRWADELRARVGRAWIRVVWTGDLAPGASAPAEVPDAY